MASGLLAGSSQSVVFMSIFPISDYISLFAVLQLHPLYNCTLGCYSEAREVVGTFL